MQYRISQFNIVYRSSCVYPLLSRINIVATYIWTNSFLATAMQCKISIINVNRIVHKYRQQVSLKAGVGGNHHVTGIKDKCTSVYQVYADDQFYALPK